MRPLLFATLLTLSAISYANEQLTDPNEVDIQLRCIRGYYWVIARDANGIDIEQMTEPSDKGMVKTPLPVSCKS